MDAAEPPRIVFESSAKCADGGRAEEFLRQMLARARAPGHAWLVTMRIGATTQGELRAEGEIVDDDGAAVGHRAFTGKATDCKGLARALGVWASLVLDGEIRRPHTVAKEEQPPATPEWAAKPPPDGGPQSDAKRQPPLASSDPQPAAPWPPTADPDEKPSRREERTLELGVGGFLMAGTGGSLLVGATPFVAIEVAKGLFIRPAIALAESLPLAQPDMTLAAMRLDGCLRMAGLYTTLHGIQLDVCGGVDAGMLDVTGRTLPYVALGPSMDLRGELGGYLAVILRGLVGVNAVHDAALDTPFLAGRGELALSWRLR